MIQLRNLERAYDQGGGKLYVLRRIDGQWKISRRKIILDQNVLLSKNLTFFF